MCTAGPLQRLTQVDPRDEIRTGVNMRSNQPNLRLGASDVPMGTGTLDAARSAIINRREKLRIAEEGS
jgi:hypothetical protein